VICKFIRLILLTEFKRIAGNTKLGPFFEAHVCDEVRLDGAVMSSFDHWRAFAAAFTQNIGTNDKQRKVPLESAFAWNFSTEEFPETGGRLVEVVEMRFGWRFDASVTLCLGVSIFWNFLES